MRASPSYPPDINFIQRAVVDELPDDAVERGELAHDRSRDTVVAALVPVRRNKKPRFLDHAALVLAAIRGKKKKNDAFDINTAAVSSPDKLQ